MLTLKSCRHLRTSRNLAGLHGCRTSTGLSMQEVAQGRLVREEKALTLREWRRRWLDLLWRAHLVRVGRKSNALRP